MVKTIELQDGEKFREVNFSKNAVFYKDLLAFYDGYVSLMETEPDLLPNYVFWNGKYCLEGICLFMKDYAVALGFESLELSLAYLKTLYYSLASLSKSEGYMPEREAVVSEFNEYRVRTDEILKSIQAELNDFQGTANSVSNNFGKKRSINTKNVALSRVFNALSIVFLSVFLAVFIVDVPLLFFISNARSVLIISVVGAASAVLAVFPTLIFKMLSKKFDEKENGTLYEMQKVKHEKAETDGKLQEIVRRLNSVKCEKYECEHNLNQILFENTRESFDEILKSAKGYYVLSYNIKRDCMVLFLNQEKDTKDIISRLSRPTKIEDSAAVINALYSEIKSKDWLYYSGLVRFAYLSKYIELAEKSFVWELGKSSGKTPFGIDVKKIAKEQVAFLKDKDSLFVSANISKFLSGNYLKKKEFLKLKVTAKPEELKAIKVAYATKFFEYDKVKDYNNLFYDKKIGSGAKVPENILENFGLIPTLVHLKLSLIEYYGGMANSESETVKTIDSTYFAEDKQLLLMSANFEPVKIESAPTTVYECEECEDMGGGIKYIYDGKTIIGYKL